MADSRRIAGLIGPTLIVLTTSEILNLHIWSVSLPPVVYLNGLLLFVAGLAIVRAHNHWTLSWPVVVTLMGWSIMALGAFRMFAPEARQGGENAATYAVIGLLCAVGVFLTYKACAPER